MIKDVGSFLGVDRTELTEADEIIGKIILYIFNFFENNLQIDLKNFGNIEAILSPEVNVNQGEEYFWDWIEENGLEKLKYIASTNVKDSDEILDLLDYRKFILSMDIENDITKSIFISIADTITIIDEALKELSATKEDFYRDLYYQIYIDIINNQKFNYTDENPAEKQQDFCYYTT